MRRTLGHLGLIAACLAGIAVTLRLLYVIVVVEKCGPVILALTADHGIHEGDVPALALGLPLIACLLAGIAFETRRLARTVRTWRRNRPR